jgi:hypothetical protein
MRVFVVKAFRRFQRRENIGDDMLRVAVKYAEKGLVDADLGGDVIKQRVARAGQGKSGGYRTLIAFRRGERAVFLFGFAKSERGNIRPHHLVELRLYAQRWLSFDDKGIGRPIADGDLYEVQCDEADEET